MALTRKFLRAMGIEDEKIEEIIEAHGETVDALKADRDKYKANAEKLPDIQKKLNEAQSNQKDKFEEKYNDLKTEYDNYKAAISEKEIIANKESAYRELLKSAGVSEKRIDTIIKVSDLSKIELAEDGKIKDAEKHSETIKTEWADFIETEQQRGADTATPPAENNGSKDYENMSMPEYIAARKKGNI